jgi:hypothetical protein
MGLTKTEIFTEEQNQLATMMKALGHPARIAILQSIIKANACVCGELEGVRVCYCIDPKVWKLFKTHMAAFFASYKEHTTCC